MNELREIETDYTKFRGNCKEMSKAMAKTNSNWRVVRGYYWCPIWNKEVHHWWVETPDGTIIDPTKNQFPSRGHGVYSEFKGWDRLRTMP